MLVVEYGDRNYDNMVNKFSEIGKIKAILFI